MDYSELKELAEAFVGRGCTDYPHELDKALQHTAQTGIVRMQWDLFSPVLHYRLEQEIDSAFIGNTLDKELPQQLLKHLDNFDNPPFTIQRLCELVLKPKKHYKKLDYYLRALEKNLLVVGTQEPDLDWMQSARLQVTEKPSENENRTRGTSHDDEPHSPPPSTSQPPPADEDSPPMAPTSTSTCPEEGGSEEEKPLSTGGGGGGGGGTRGGSGGDGKEGGRTHSPPLPNRKRSRDSLEQDAENGSTITVRQEADSTVNIEPPSFEPLPPSFQVVDEFSVKRSRESGGGLEGGGEDARKEEGQCGEGEEKMDTCVKNEERILSSSSERVTLMDTGRVGEGGRGEGEGVKKGGGGVSDGDKEGAIHEASSDSLAKLSSREAATPTDQADGKQEPTDCPEAMLTN